MRGDSYTIREMLDEGIFQKLGVSSVQEAEDKGLMIFDQFVNQGHDWNNDPMYQDPGCDIIEPYWALTPKGEALLCRK